MASSSSEITYDLKSLAVVMSGSDKEIANRVYDVMRTYLIDKRLAERQQNLRLQPDNASRDATNALDEYLFDRRLTKQFLDTVDSTSGQKFLELTGKLQNDSTFSTMDRIRPLKFLMAMGRKRSADESILKDRLKTPLPRCRPLKGKAPPPPDSDSSDKSSLSGATLDTKISSASLSNSTGKQSPSTSAIKSSSSSSLVNGHKTEVKPEVSMSCSRVNERMAALDVGGDLSEWDVIEGLLFVWQGVYSKIFRRCETSQRYLLHEKWHVYTWVREQADNLATLGYFHDILLPYGETTADLGLIRKCLAGFVRDQLSEYYALIASVRTEFQKQTLCNDRTVGCLTLMGLRLQSTEVERTFMDLISILEFTRDDRGGILASKVYSFIKHGDPTMQRLVKQILAGICEPLYGMMTKWLLEGTLSDPSKEFFIAADSSITGDRMWNDKYSIRISMLPEFISAELAQKVLSVGRSINFLSERCDNHQPFAQRETLRNLFHTTSPEIMYLYEQNSELEKLVDRAYEETNSRVLRVLLETYSLLDHFQAHRKFLLLGQGEFVHHLMDLLMDVLGKPAGQLHPHFLNSILDSAVRATTAQFEPDDIINRLDAATLIPTDGDTGWEVFYLRYHVDGPIGTVFSLASRNEYQKLFCALWKAKRMEMVLSKAWKHQTTCVKVLRRVGEMGQILRTCHELIAEMLHFVRQTQYYFLFEVLECAWNQLIEDVQEAGNLDAVITAHTEFLQKVTAGVFMDQDKIKLSLQLRVIYGLVLNLVSHVAKILSSGEREARDRTNPPQDESRIEYLRKRREFVANFVPEAIGGLKSLGRTYRRTIKQFLLSLNSEDDLNLQLLSVRLDFNSYYKQLDSRLEAPLTFQHRRMSSIGGELSPILTRKFSGERRKKKPQ